MKNIIVITAKLLIITLVAGAVLGLVYSVTKEPIAQQDITAANEARFAAFPEAAGFEEQTFGIPDEYAIIETIHTALDAQGNAIGITAAVVTKGYSAGLHLTVGIGNDGVIKGVIIGSHQETPGLGAKASEEWFYSQYEGKAVDQPLAVVKSGANGDYDIEAITSATITTNGITDAVNTVATYFAQIAGGAQ